MRMAITLLSLPLMAFCLFGFLASFEPGIKDSWKLLYGTLLALLSIAAIAPWCVRRSQ